jgi:hypothetical protein
MAKPVAEISALRVMPMAVRLRARTASFMVLPLHNEFARDGRRLRVHRSLPSELKDSIRTASITGDCRNLVIGTSFAKPLDGEIRRT